jgi:hypothetical protein
MPPRFAYWTILAGGLPTSFRAADKDELMPTFRRISEKHPDAVMKYFARGKLWESPEEARRALEDAQRSAKPGRRGPHAGEKPRGRDWRPGGEHRDPRQPFKDAKKARNQDRRQQRWNRKDQRRDSKPGERPRMHNERKPPRTKPHGDKFRDEVPRRPFRGSSGGRFTRNQHTPSHPPRPAGPDREPPPARDPKPEPPPRPSEPSIKPPGPPERGRTPDAGGRLRKRRRGE